MRIHVRKSTMVRPAAPTPTGSLRLSHLDLVKQHYHIPLVFFYHPTIAVNFFDPTLLTAALSSTLVHFYPSAGRLKRNNNRIEINCNAEGVLFVEAECDGTVDELGDFAPKPELSLVPAVDYSLGISTFPLMLFQITRFKCGGVCLGAATQDNLSDGFSFFHFMRTWSEIARGLDVGMLPFLDRTVLRARKPPRPEYVHIEFQPPPAMKSSQQKSETIFSIFKLTRDQLNALKAQCYASDKTEETKDRNIVNYTTYEVLAGHIWRCVSKARGLPEDQETKVYIATEVRSRLRPPLPPGYYGNAILRITPITRLSDLQSKPLSFVVKKIHNTLAGMNDRYLRSALDYLDLQPNLNAFARGSHIFNCPNLQITSWVNLRIYDEDFGWGKPFFVGIGAIPAEGKSFVIPSCNNDGSLLYAISLPKEHMKKFEKLLYQNIASKM